MKRSRRELSIDMVINEGIFKDNQITLLPCSAFVYPNQGLVFTVAPLAAEAYSQKEIKLRIFLGGQANDVISCFT